MADSPNPEQQDAAQAQQLEGGTYEVIRGRLRRHGKELDARLAQLNAARKEVFGGVETRLLSTEHIATSNNCTPRDMIPVGEHLLFGYNVHLGLRSEIRLGDVFAVYSYKDRRLNPCGLDLISDDTFLRDFKELYRFYKKTRFAKFAIIGPALFMVFQVGKGIEEIKTFKWLLGQDGTLQYVGNRSDHEYTFPPQHDFEWTRTTRDMHRGGLHPHVSIEDRVFVETVGGDLTVKIEDNTDDGTGIYAEPVDNPDQTLDDAEVHYATVGDLILMRIKPYQEQQWRYIVYSEKVNLARRIDSIASACVLLPEEHGIIFPNGYFLQTGDYKEFEGAYQGMRFEKRISAPNGEDYLFVFYSPASGDYVLLSYNIIEQQLSTPMSCSGFCLFDNGEMVQFRHDDEPRRAHPIQIWQTPFLHADYEEPRTRDSHLFKIGNKDIVQCMAGCRSVLNLVGRDDAYGNLYVDIVRQSTDVLDAHFWLDHDAAFNIREPLAAVREAATAALEEFEKVRRLRRETQSRMREVGERARKAALASASGRFPSVDQYVQALAELRGVRGEVIALRDLRYADEARIQEMEDEIVEAADRVSRRCVEFLLDEQALAPYEQRVERVKERLEGLQKTSDAKALDEEIGEAAGGLELLIDVVSNLQIDDTTQRTRIIDNISAVYASLNQVRSAARRRARELAAEEGRAEFASQMKLLSQAVTNYLDVADTPERCDEYLSKLALQLQELEARFADFDEFIGQLIEKGQEIQSAFESRKVSLVEARNRRADALGRSAERVLQSLRSRVAALDTVEAIHGFFASDMMAAKVREIIETLNELGDVVRAGDLQARLKTIREDAVRQLKDRTELFDGDNLINLGGYRFSVNTQPLELTVVPRDDRLFLHLVGTRFFEEIADEELLATRAVWNQETVSENQDVYRGEYLAYLVFRSICKDDAKPNLVDAAAWNDEERLEHVRQFMSTRYAESYVKGVHDHDAAAILHALVELHGQLGLLRYRPDARAMANILWHACSDKQEKNRLDARLRGLGRLTQVFPDCRRQNECVTQLKDLLAAEAQRTGLFDPVLADEAAEYLFHVQCNGGDHPISQEAAELYEPFVRHLQSRDAERALRESLRELFSDTAGACGLVRDWLNAYLRSRDLDETHPFANEVVALYFTESFDSTRVVNATTRRELKNMAGDHPILPGGQYVVDYVMLMARLGDYMRTVVPQFECFGRLKQERVEAARVQMRLEEFKSQVMSSFVRNRLIDQVYLPLVGANLAKQIGTAGDKTRTDRMGMLLLISPPGYGKTTLMEYIANRLGLIFMKINGPAIGHRVTSIDPGEAPNAAAREELKKLNLALEMGDNVMLYVDDIQHCSPEFLQKFISLCDAQRKIEGVYKGQARTYDLRGRKVAVVMAGNPYTESGEAFKIPDMLSNRADTYNLGDIAGDKADAFNLSFLENALTSNPSLAPLANRSQKDVYAVVRIAETGSHEGADFEGRYGQDELADMVSVMQKLMQVRDVITTVNDAYIRSAAQADAYRTEPPFKLQGSYRNMNRLAEKILPVMNDEELKALVQTHYENEAQTLTTGAEANLLKFKELTGWMASDEAARWEQIKKTFRKRQTMMGVDASDRFGQVIAQISGLTEGLEAIGDAVGALHETEHKKASSGPPRLVMDPESLEWLEALLRQMQPSAKQSNGEVLETRLSKDTVDAIITALEKLPAATVQVPEPRARMKEFEDATPDDVLPAPSVEGPSSLSAHDGAATSRAPAGVHFEPRFQVVTRLPQGLLHVIRQQYKLMEAWLEPLWRTSARQGDDIQRLRTAMEGVSLSYKNALAELEKMKQEKTAE